jgi:hypothetical protein
VGLGGVGGGGGLLRGGDHPLTMLRSIRYAHAAA